MACLSHAFLMLMFSCHTAAVPPESLDEILQRNDAALGGTPAFQNIDNLRFELDIREPEFNVSGVYVASRGEEMRIDIHADGQRVFAEGLHRDAAWQWSSDSGWTLPSDASAAALRHGIESPGRFFTLQQLRERGAQVKLSTPALLAKDDELQLEITLADGARIFYFLDENSYLPTREISRRAFHPGNDPREISVETTFADPVTVDGVLRFRKSESHNLITGEWLGTTIVQAVEHNVHLPPDFFAAESRLLSVSRR